MTKQRADFLAAMKRFVGSVDGKNIGTLTITVSGQEPVVIDKAASDRIKRNIDAELARRKRGTK